MNIYTYIDRGTARFVATIAMCTMLLSALPVHFFVAEAANTDTIAASVDPDGSPERFSISYTGGTSLALDGWEVEDAASFSHVLPDETLSSGESWTVCQTGGDQTGCDENWGGANVWNDLGDTFTLKDANGEVILTFTFDDVDEASDDTEIEVLQTKGGDKIYLCHATGNDNNPYLATGVSINSFFGGHSEDTEDIIPPFFYDAGDGVMYFAGNNWGDDGQSLWEEYECDNVDVDDDLTESSETIVVSGDTISLDGGWWFNRDTANATPIAFNEDEASIGDGSLYVEPISNADAPRKFIGEYYSGQKIADTHSISYDFMIGTGGDASDDDEFYMNVYANFGESAADKYYDCKYDVVPTTGSTASFTTETFDPTLSYPVTTRGDSPYTCPAIPADMDNDSPNSFIRMFALNLGDTSLSDADLDGYFDKVVNVVQTDDNVHTTTFDFEPAEEVVACTVTLVSDMTDFVVEKGADAQELSFVHAAWTAVIGGAKWIWGDDPVVSPATAETQTFTKKFGWNGPITSATLMIAADNSYESELNGLAAGADATEKNFNAAGQDAFDVKSLIDQGNNELSVAVTNWKGSSNPKHNPAGLLYKLEIVGTDEQCDVPYEEPVTIVAHKIVCEDESMLPNWGAGVADISSTTATTFVAENDGCDFEEGWEFQWGKKNASDPGDTLIGPAGGNKWHTFGPTDSDGMASVELFKGDYKKGKHVWMREVLQEGYIPFTHEENGNNSDDVTAEMYCHIDAKNYDNYDRVDGISAENTYYCVAFNAEKEVIKPVCEIGENLLVNGSFEEPMVKDHGGKWELFDTIPGWTSNVSSNGIELQRGLFGGASDGEQHAELDVHESTVLTQTVPTQVGATYEMRFDFSARDKNAANNSVEVFADATQVANVYSGNTEWETYSGTFVADASTDISFFDQGVSNGHGTLIDNAVLCLIEEAPKTSEVTVCKLDQYENELSGWQLSLLGEKVDTLEVDPDGTTQSMTNIQAGSYVLKADGVYEYRGSSGLLADARFSERKAGDPGYGTYPYQPWREASNTTGGLAVQVNSDLGALWGGIFSPAHIYYGALEQAATADVDFYVYDNAYADNVGTVTVDLFEGWTGLTGKNGCVVFSDVPFGDYQTEELLQDGWENLSGLGDVTVDEASETFYIVNTDTPVGPHCGDGVNGGEVIDGVQDWEQCDGEKGCTDYCTWENQCQDLRLMQIVMDASDSASFNDTVYLGSASNPLPNGTWFNFDELGDDSINDIATNENGLAVSRDTVNEKLFVGFRGGNKSKNIDIAAGTINTLGISLGGIDPKAITGWKLEAPGEGFVDIFEKDGESIDFDLRADTGNDAVSVEISDGDSYDCPECKATVEARVVLSDLDGSFGNNGDGNLAQEVVLGDGSVYAFGEWFPVSEAAFPGDSATYINDPKTVTDFDAPADTEGIFVSREGDGTVKLALYGYHSPGGNTNNEYITGTLEFRDTSILAGSAEALNGSFKLENHSESDAVPTNDGRDTISEAGDLSGVHFDLWVDTKADGFKVTVDEEATLSCDEDTEDLFPIDGYKWNDVNGDGERGDEAGIGGWWIYVTNGDVTYSATTSQDGSYHFDVPAGTWEVYEEEREGWKQTAAHGGNGMYQAVRVNDDVYEDEDPYDYDSCLFYFGEDKKPLFQQAFSFVTTLIDGPQDDLREGNHCDFGNMKDSNGGGDVLGCSISADEVFVSSGTEIELTWSTIDGSFAMIDNGIGDVALSGATTTTVTEDTTFMMTVYDAQENEATCSVAIDVETDTRGRTSNLGGRIPRTPDGIVAGASTQCGMYLYDYMREGITNEVFEVQKLQIFLLSQGYFLPITGVFDLATDNAVRQFQQIHKAEVLTPWFEAGIMNHDNPTGYVYKTTRWKINNIVCPGSEAWPNIEAG